MPLRSTLFLSLLALSSLGAQQQQFTTQVMILPAFNGSDRRIASAASDIIRDRVASAFPKRELRMVSAGDIDDWLRRSGFDQNTALLEGELRELAKKFRADERITGLATRLPSGRVRVDAQLTLVRDLRLTQALSAEAPNVDSAANMVARDAIAARKQFIPLRECENFERSNRIPEAIAAATAAINAYPKAVPARICLLNTLAKTEAKPDTIVDVSRAILAASPTNSIALEDLAQALDLQGKADAAAPVWLQLFATDSASDTMIEKVVNALSREGKPEMAEPIIDRGTEAYPDNLPMLKLRWLVHLAANDWKGAVAAGQKLLDRDAASQADPNFFERLATAYSADSQPTLALRVAADGVSRFSDNAPLYVEYVRLLHEENEAALPRALASHPESAELHALAAQNLKSSGNANGALIETKLALTANPKLPHGYLQLAQLEIDAGQADSALDALQLAIKNGEARGTVAQFALARGNAMYKAASTTLKREDYQRAVRYLSFAKAIAPTPEAKFLLGASSLSVSQSAATEAPAKKSCDLSRLAESSLTDAETNLTDGESVAPDAAKQYLDYVAKLKPYIAEQIKSFCSGAN